jgi:hypothetical protein
MKIKCLLDQFNKKQKVSITDTKLRMFVSEFYQTKLASVKKTYKPTSRVIDI